MDSKLVGATAELIGFDNLTKPAVALLATHVDHRLRLVVQEAVRVMRHSRRGVLTVDDVKQALVSLKVPRVYGGARAGVAAELEDRHQVVLKDPILNLEAEVAGLDVAATPVGPTFAVHWLSVQGSQPTIIENPAPSGSKKRARTAAAAAPKAEPPPPQPSKPQGDDVTIKPPVQHLVSEELQWYFEKVVKAVHAGSYAQLVAVCGCVSSDHGLQQLMPYFSQFILNESRNGLANFARARGLLLLVQSLLKNPDLHLELYLHQILPAIVTFALTRTLCEPHTPDSPSQHFVIRQRAVALMAQLFGNKYPSLSSRVIDPVKDALLSPTASLGSQYGALLAVGVLGRPAFRTLLLPVLRDKFGEYESRYVNGVSLVDTPDENSGDAQTRDAAKCYEAAMALVGRFGVKDGVAVTDAGEVVTGDPYDLGEAMLPTLHAHKGSWMVDMFV